MWSPLAKCPDGKYYHLDIETQIAGAKRWNIIFRLDFHRKAIIGFLFFKTQQVP
ncbi:hypothetical protein [uncultured Polaribacter sp.]|uniref:hypothetical protein n=1 Tax=uncultured Polaribacter sp. TaxID=174711 RepID=UPI00263A02A9|nr:hypothetical protein [uncultured Polaribacter sp.]